MAFKKCIALTLMLLTASSALAQDAQTNAEIVKLVKAGLPEAVILRKITE